MSFATIGFFVSKLWLPLGYLFLAIGAIGVVLPLLPTTPFVLLAAGCFSRSSPRLHAWLMNSELFGPILRDWEERKCICLKVKVFAISMTLGVGGGSILSFGPEGWPRYAGLALVLVGCAVIISLPLCRDNNKAPDQGPSTP